MARAIVAKKGGDFAARRTEVETYLDTTHGIVVPVGIKNTDPSVDTDFFFDMDPKTIIGPLCKHYGIKKFDIAKHAQDADIFDDIRTLINDLLAMCR